MHHDFSLLQTVTATSDKAAAWNSLRAALNTLWNQKSLASSVRGVVWVTMYLGCISALKIMTLALFRLVPAICITQSTVNTTLMNLFMLNTRYVYFTQNFNIAKNLHHTK